MQIYLKLVLIFFYGVVRAPMVIIKTIMPRMSASYGSSVRYTIHALGAVGGRLLSEQFQSSMLVSCVKCVAQVIQEGCTPPQRKRF